MNIRYYTETDTLYIEFRDAHGVADPFRAPAARGCQRIRLVGHERPCRAGGICHAGRRLFQPALKARVCVHDTKLQGSGDATFLRGAACRGVSRLHQSGARRLTLLDSAETLGDLAALPSNRLEALRGGRVGQHSIRINAQ